MRSKVSVVMIVKNEERNMKEALDTVKGWADEIVVVDDESTDKTCQITGEYTDKIFHRKMDLEGKHRNWAASKATNDWIMILDADERMTPELRNELDGILSKKDDKTVGYWIPQKCYLGDYWLRYGGWSAPHIRLYDRRFLKWKEIPADVVHPGIEMAPGYGGTNLKNHLIHYNFKNIEDFIAKTNRQSTLEAIKWHLDGRKVTLARGLMKGFVRFYKRYLYKQGYKDGYYGFAAAVLSGFYQFAAYSKFREIKERGVYLKT